MRTTPVYKANFTGMRVRIIEKQGNPCHQPNLRHHFDSRYKMILITTTQSNKDIEPGYWHFKLVTTKQSWNALVRSQYHEPSTMVVGTNEVIIDMAYVVAIVQGLPSDVLEIKMKSLKDGFEYVVRIFIPHGMKPPVPMRKHTTNAAL
jgi:hypothetical protein